MLIAQATDLHIGFEREGPYDSNMQRFETVLARLTEASSLPDMLLLTGDLTEHGDAESFARLADAVGGLPFPVWPMAGNHDSRAVLCEVFPHVSPQDGFIQYSVEADGLRLVLLDTLEDGRHGGAFCEARADWLARELTAHPDTPTVIVMHHPPFPAGIDWLDCREDEPWVRRFADSIAGHGQVEAILCGHLHRTIYGQFNGIPAMVCPSTAPQIALDLRAVDPDHSDGRAMVVAEPPGYALHRWDGKRLISHSAMVADVPVLARYDAEFQEMVRINRAERGG